MILRWLWGPHRLVSWPIAPWKYSGAFILQVAIHFTPYVRSVVSRDPGIEPDLSLFLDRQDLLFSLRGSPHFSFDSSVSVIRRVGTAAPSCIFSSIVFSLAAHLGNPPSPESPNLSLVFFLFQFKRRSLRSFIENIYCRFYFVFFVAHASWFFLCDFFSLNPDFIVYQVVVFHTWNSILWWTWLWGCFWYLHSLLLLFPPLGYSVRWDPLWTPVCTMKPAIIHSRLTFLYISTLRGLPPSIF